MGDIVPRCLPISSAAQYVGLSETAFRSTVAPSVRPVYLTPRRPVWLKDQLDKWIDARAGIINQTSEDDLMDAITNN
ncbi:helix-turn-helix transcriptional regulator [Acetobacter sp.]|uniref:helix-turn-helix transcriptional regulator n=1 Tax=Acetobacter sp. TaxID=440 RepID=UPI0039EC1089